MIVEIQNAIDSKVVLRIRMNGTPEENHITVEPHLILHNILFNTNRLLIFIVEHWAEGGHIGWTDISLDSIVWIEKTEQLFADRNPKPVDWQTNNQLYPPPVN